MSVSNCALSNGCEGFKKNVTAALETIEEIEQLLSCNFCERFTVDPVILWHCDHIFCHLCIDDRDCCPTCQMPAWPEDHSEIATLTDVATLSARLKLVLQGHSTSTSQSQDESRLAWSTANQPFSSGIRRSSLLTSSTHTVRENLIENKPTNNKIISTSGDIPMPPRDLLQNVNAEDDNSNQTDDDIDHVEERLQEILSPTAEMPFENEIITPIDEVEVQDVIEDADDKNDEDVLNYDPKDVRETDVFKVQDCITGGLPSAEGEMIEKSAYEKENWVQKEIASSTDKETQLDDPNTNEEKGEIDVNLNRNEMQVSHSQELLEQVAADALNASLREIRASFVDDSSGSEMADIAPHELLPLNMNRKRSSSLSNETSHSPALELLNSTRSKSRSKAKGKRAVIKRVTASDADTEYSYFSDCLPNFRPNAAPDKAVKSDGETKRRKLRSRVKICPSRAFPQITEDSEESPSNATPLLLQDTVFTAYKGKKGEANEKKSKNSTPAAVNSPILSNQLSTSEKIPVTPKNVSALKISSAGRRPGMKTPKALKKNKKGETALHLAAIRGQVDEIKKLIEDGAQLNGKDNAGWTSLHEACHHGHVQAAEELLCAGALINIPGYDNETPLMDAARQGHVDVVKLLLSNGADINLRSCYGLTALDLATSETVKEVIEEHQILTQAAMNSLSSQNFNTSAPDDIIMSHSMSLKTDKVKAAAAVLNATVNIKDMSNVTHHIMQSIEERRCPRTLKYLQAVAKGIWIVGNDWLDACVNSGLWVSEQAYEMLGSKEDLIDGGPKRSRINRAAQYPPVFYGCHFYLHGSFKAPGLTKQQIGDILKLAGGKMLTREPKPDSDSVQSCKKVPYHARKDSPQYFYTYYVVYDSKNGKPPRCVRRGKVCPVPLSWALDCVSQFYLCEIPE